MHDTEHLQVTSAGKHKKIFDIDLQGTLFKLGNALKMMGDRFDCEFHQMSLIKMEPVCRVPSAETVTQTDLH